MKYKQKFTTFAACFYYPFFYEENLIDYCFLRIGIARFDCSELTITLRFS